MNLNDMMQFDHVITVNEDGSVDDGPLGLYAPDASVDGHTISVGGGWELLSGFTQQYYYNGPVMHPSEYVGGALEEHILSTPGHYAIAVVMDEDGNDIGWAVAYQEASES